LRQASLYRGVDVAKLGVAVRMILPLLGLAIALETVIEIVKNLGDLIWLTGWFCWPSSLAIVRVLLQIHRRGDSGSPRV
jgi:hypothetical protein